MGTGGRTLESSFGSLSFFVLSVLIGFTFTAARKKKKKDKTGKGGGGTPKLDAVPSAEPSPMESATMHRNVMQKEYVSLCRCLLFDDILHHDRSIFSLIALYSSLSHSVLPPPMAT
jgi:hypothetical protein